jgi:hypothetical protein
MSPHESLSVNVGVGERLDGFLLVFMIPFVVTIYKYMRARESKTKSENLATRTAVCVYLTNLLNIKYLRGISFEHSAIEQ